MSEESSYIALLVVTSSTMLPSTKLSKVARYQAAASVWDEAVRREVQTCNVEAALHGDDDVIELERNEDGTYGWRSR